jgi:hypothetical protein
MIARVILTLSLVTAAACQRTQPVAPLAAWEPIDKSFTGCEGG